MIYNCTKLCIFMPYCMLTVLFHLYDNTLTCCCLLRLKQFLMFQSFNVNCFHFCILFFHCFIELQLQTLLALFYLALLYFILFYIYLCKICTPYIIHSAIFQYLSHTCNYHSRYHRLCEVKCNTHYSW